MLCQVLILRASQSENLLNLLINNNMYCQVQILTEENDYVYWEM